MSPLNRLRRKEGLTCGTDANNDHIKVLTSPKRKSPATTTAANVAPSPRLNGDYHVLQQGVDQHRESVQGSKMALAAALDRLGEHHVRHREYDNAMDAFTEALQEKRSILTTILPPSGRGDSPTDSDDGEDPSSLHSSVEDAIDELIQTLRSLGNVHSLRGEQDEAMRYFTEVTNLRASKAASRSDSGDDTTLFSGLNNTDNEDNSTMMSEINEDVKALDDMFRSISFRSRDAGSFWSANRTKPLGSSNSNTSAAVVSNKRQKNEVQPPTGIQPVESEPFRRSSSMGVKISGNELSDAMDTYKSVLESYKGPRYEQHTDTYNSLALRVELLAETLQRPDSDVGAPGVYAPDLELAVEIYCQILSAQKEMITEENRCDPKVCSNVASTLIRMGSLYYKVGNRLEELRMYKEAKDVYCRAFGEQHSCVAGARKNIGMVLAERGEYEKASEEFEQARLIYLSVNDGNEMNREVASAISCMGNVKNRLGELDEALAQYMEALRIYRYIQGHVQDLDKEALVASARDVTATLKVIGMVHAKKNDQETAMSFFSEAMNLLRSSGADHTPLGRETTSSVLTRMASIFVKRGELDKALDYYREAYDITVRNRGTTNHHEVAGILHYIGGVFHKRSEYDEAMECYQESIRIYHSTLGPGNSTVAGTLVMVGSIHYKRRNLDSAKMFYREALRLNREVYGLHHPDVAPILKSIGTILTKKGEYQEAYDVFRDVLSIKCTVHGTGHPEVAGAYKSLGNVHYKLGELADAERQYRHALSIYRRTRGEDHPDTVAARTTIEHIRYWMKERGQRKLDQRHDRGLSPEKRDDDEHRY